MTIPTESPAAEPTPGYRCFTGQPATIRLAMMDLESQLPDGTWIGTSADRSRVLDLPAAEILKTNYPRVRFSTLCDLLPGCLRALPGTPEWIALPADRVALAYRPETHRQPLAEPAAPPPESLELSPPPPAAPQMPGWKKLPKPTLAPIPAPAANEIGASDSGNPAVTTNGTASLANLGIRAEAQASLGKIFLTDDALTVQRLIDRASRLPGIDACAISRLGESVKSANAVAAFDPSAIHGDTAGLLRKAAAASDLRYKPAVTLYTEGGLISFLQHAAVSMLVIHSEPGFMPGTIEKLEAVLEAIENAASESDTARRPRSEP